MRMILTLSPVIDNLSHIKLWMVVLQYHIPLIHCLIQQIILYDDTGLFVYICIFLQQGEILECSEYNEVNSRITTCFGKNRKCNVKGVIDILVWVHCLIEGLLFLLISNIKSNIPSSHVIWSDNWHWVSCINCAGVICQWFGIGQVYITSICMLHVVLALNVSWQGQWP